MQKFPGHQVSRAKGPRESEFTSRQRVQKCREKKKEKQQVQDNKVTTRQVATARDDQKEIWRLQKQKQREAMTPQQKRRKKEARREQYKQKKEHERAKLSIQSGARDSDSEHIEQRTPCAQRKALQRARSALPSSPRKFVSTVTALVGQYSPRKRQLFQKGNLLRVEREEQQREQQMGRLLLQAIHRLRLKNFSKDRLARRVLLDTCKGSGSFRKRSSVLRINKKTVRKHEQASFMSNSKPLKMQKETEKKAAEFLEQEATPLPDKKLVSKKTGKGAAQLTQPLRILHKRYNEETGQKMFFFICQIQAIKCKTHGSGTFATVSLRVLYQCAVETDSLEQGCFCTQTIHQLR